MERKYYPYGHRGRWIILRVCIGFFIASFFFKKSRILAYWACNIGLVIEGLWLICTFFIKTYIDEEGLEETTLGFRTRKAKWEEIDMLVMGNPKYFFVSIVGRRKMLIAYSSSVKDYEELTRELLQICEEKYPHIQIDPEIYKELEKAETKKENNRLRIEQVKKFLTRGKDYKLNDFINRINE